MQPIESLRQSLLRFVYPYTSELKLQDCIEAALCQTGYSYQREYTSGRDRVDFLVDAEGESIALECKIAGGPSAVLEQLLRYANQPEVDGVLLVTSRHTHQFSCDTLNDKPFLIAWIAGNL